MSDRPRGRALKRRREIYTAVIEEHVGAIAYFLPRGDLESANVAVRRIGELLDDLKALEGWTWNLRMPPEWYEKHFPDHASH